MSKLPSLRPNLKVPGRGREDRTLAGKESLLQGNSEAQQILNSAKGTSDAIMTEAAIANIHTQAAADQKKIKAQGKADIVNASMSLFRTVKSLKEDYEQKRSKDQIRNADLESSKSNTEFIRLSSGKKFYTQEEVKDIPGFENDSRAKIPSDEVNPIAYRTFMEDKLDTISESISDSKSRDSWRKNRQIALEEQMVREYISADRKRGTRLAAEEINTIEDAVKNDQFGVATNALNASKFLTKDQIHDYKVKVETAHTKYNHDKTVDFVEQSIIANDEGILLKTLDHMVNDDKSALKPRERRLYADHIRAKIKSINKAKEDLSSIIEAKYNQQIRDTKSSLEAGHSVSPASIQTALDNAELLKKPDETLKLERAITINNGVRTLVDEPLAIQESIINTAIDGNQSSEVLAISDGVQKGLIKFRNQLNSDSIGTGLSYGSGQLSPLNFSSEEAFVASAQKRVIDAKVLNMKYGTKNMLSNVEAKQLATNLANVKGADNKLQLVSAITTSFGPEAVTVFEQMKQEKPNAYAFAGVMASQGLIEDAKIVMLGSDMIKDSKNYKQHALQNDANEMISGVFRDAKQRKSALAAIESYYAYNAQNEKVDQTVDYSEELLNQAIKSTIGEITSYGDSEIVLPIQGSNFSNVANYFNNIDPTYVDENMGKAWDGAVEIPGKQLMKEIHDGTYRLVQKSQDEFYLEDTRRPGKYLGKKDGTGFVFKYDKNAKMVTHEFNIFDSEVSP